MAGQARQAKVLCIRIIQGKNVLDKTIEPGESVTVGESSSNLFVLPKSHLPTPEFPLFRASGNGYVLHFTDKMKGKVESRGSVARLQQLFEDPSVTRKNGIAQIPLTEQDRGKLKIDSVTVLFQFLPPPPAHALKPIQQMDFRPRLLEDDDPVFLGFLAIWSALAMVLVIWVWNTEPREYTLEDIPDRFAKVLVPEKKEPVVEPELEETEGTEIEREVDNDAVAEVNEQVEEAPRTEVEEIQVEQERKDQMVQTSALLKVLASTGESTGGIVENLWSSEDQGLGDIDKALAEAGALVTTTAELRETQAGGNEAAEVDVKGIGGGTGRDVSGPAVTVKPVVRAEGGTIDASGDESAVKDVVRRYTGQLQYCYEKRLKAVPTLEGRVEVGWSMSAGAGVGSPYVISNSTGDAELADCITKKIRRWSFPEDVDGELSWPFAFQAKK
ncbi:MAG TPA: AgmX/PglI C-terminal domain-containing protein [Deltaproteobacteria bacterium]|nr:AgmX/PglI C-terminal domain-containing protein [Deltaproteobacteria bacterium]